MNSRFAFFTCLLLALAVSMLAFKSTNNDPSPKLIWEDHFNIPGLPNQEVWSYDVGKGCELPCGCGWGNQELQEYIANNPNNARIENGNLVLQVHQEKSGNITSARIHTKNSINLKNGIVEVRAKNASCKGAWSAIWMLPTDNRYGIWPKSGEIDIMEHVAFEPDSIYSAVHVEAYNHMIGTHKNGAKHVETATQDFHTYKLIWDESSCSSFVDDQLIFTFENNNEGQKYWPFDEEFYLIFNVAFGGNWGGREGIDTDCLPTEMLVDYVKIYQ